MDHRKLNIGLVCEYVDGPIDEGMKKMVISLIEQLKKKRNVCVFGRSISSVIGYSYSTNRFYLDQKIISDIRKFGADIILYFPEASLTMGAFLRAKILRTFIGKPLVIVGLQTWFYSRLSKYVLRFIHPDLILTQSLSTERFYQQIKLKTGRLRSGIELGKFRPATPEKKRGLRNKYNLPIEKKIVLHVGHINEHRSLKDLFPIARELAHILIVGSTSTLQDKELKDELINDGATLIDVFIESIEEVYQLADLYIFPTRHYTAALEFPLSVLEAMACGLPILTTRFGGLVDYFSNDNCFRYYEDLSEAREIASFLLSQEADVCHSNVAKVNKFSWDFVTEELLDTIDQL